MNYYSIFRPLFKFIPSNRSKNEIVFFRGRREVFSFRQKTGSD